MNKTNCIDVRRELDELRMGDEYSPAATTHLQHCSECQDFHQKQTRLREIVGSLGTVAAPPDFDFRLRRRLAETGGESLYRFPSMSWFSGARAMTAAVAVVVFFVTFIAVQKFKTSDPGVATIPNSPSVVSPTTTVAIKSSESATLKVEPGPAVATTQVPHDKTKASAREFVAPIKVKQSLAAKEFSSTAAQVIKRDQLSASSPFPIDASIQSFTLSLDDGSGVSRTISVPTVTFGSQRVVGTNVSNRLAPKGVW